MRRFMMVLTITSCSGRSSDSRDGANQTEGPYIIDAPPTELPHVDPPTLAQGIEAALDAVFTFDLSPIAAGYDAVLADTEEGCPNWAVSDGTPYWTASCVTSDGASFDGYGASLDYADVDNGDGMTYAGLLISSVSTVTTTSGDVFTGGGVAYSMTGTNTAGHQVAGFGTTDGFLWTGPEAEDTWMTAPGSLEFEFMQVQTEAYRAATLDGMVSGPGKVQAVVFQDLLAVDHAGRPEGCAWEPSGEIAVLDEDGNWYDLTFDGIDDEGSLDPEVGCDGCATAWFEGYPLDRVCFRPDVLFDWSL